MTPNDILHGIQAAAGHRNYFLLMSAWSKNYGPWTQGPQIIRDTPLQGVVVYEYHLHLTSESYEEPALSNATFNVDEAKLRRIAWAFMQKVH